MRLVNPIYVCSQSVTSLIGNNTAHNRGFDFHLLAILDLSVIPSIWQLNEIYTVHLRLSNQLHSCFKIHCMLVTYVNFKYFMLNQIVINFSLSSCCFFRALQLMFKNKFTYGQLNHILNIRCMGGRGKGGGSWNSTRYAFTPFRDSINCTNLLVLDITVCVLDISVCVGSSQLWFSIYYKTEMQNIIIKEKYFNYATK